MKKQCISIAFFIGFMASKVNGQTSSEMLDQSYDRDFRVELTTGFGKGINVNSIQATRYLWIGDKNIFNIGSGLRFSNTNFRDLQFKNVGISKYGINEFAVDGSIFSLNLYLSAEFSYKGKICLGANSDFLGFVFGVLTPHHNLPIENDGKDSKRMGLGAKVPDLNYNLFGNNRQGSNVFEIYSGVHITDNLWVKIGLSRVYNQMVMSQALDRLESSSYVLNAGCRFRF